MKKTILFTILASSLFLNTALAQECPGFPQRGIVIIDTLFNPTLAFGDDDQRRQLTRTFIEQLVFEFPAEGWTWKSADPGRPPSKDSIARHVDDRLCNWDWQNGTTRLRSVQAGQRGEDITGQHPLPVAGVNHLGSTTPPPVVIPPVNPPAPPAVDLTPIFQRLDSLDEAVATLNRLLNDTRGQLAGQSKRVQTVEDVLLSRPIPTSCRASVFGIPVSCRLEP